MKKLPHTSNWRWEKHKKGGWIVFAFSSFFPTEVTDQKQMEFSFWSNNQNLNAADKNRERERRNTQNNYTGSFHKPEVVLSPLHFQGEFNECNIWLQLLTATTSKRLQITQAQLQEISYAPELNRETSYAQAHKKETFIQTELQINLFEFEHLIYNQWGSQCKSDTDS